MSAADEVRRRLSGGASQDGSADYAGDATARRIAERMRRHPEGESIAIHNADVQRRAIEQRRQDDEWVRRRIDELTDGAEAILTHSQRTALRARAEMELKQRKADAYAAAEKARYRDAREAIAHRDSPSGQLELLLAQVRLQGGRTSPAQRLAYELHSKELRRAGIEPPPLPEPE